MVQNSGQPHRTTLQRFEPATNGVYSIETVAVLLQVPRRQIAVYFKYGLVAPTVDPADGGWWFDREAIRALRQIEYLRESCGINLSGIKRIRELTKELELLREKLHLVNQP